MITVGVATAAMMLASASLAWGQSTVDVTLNCLEAVANSGRRGICDANLCATPTNLDRLFIINGHYGFKCDGAAGFRFELCVKRDPNDNDVFFWITDEFMNNNRSLAGFGGPDDATAVYTQCEYIVHADRLALWNSAQPRTGSGTELFNKYPNGAYVVLTIETLIAERGIPAGAVESKDLYATYANAQLVNNDIPVPIMFRAGVLGCRATERRRQPNDNHFNGVQYFVDGAALYSCRGRNDHTLPTFQGCIIGAFALPPGLMQHAESNYIPFADGTANADESILRLKRAFRFVDYTSSPTTPRFASDQIALMTKKELCAAVNNELQRDPNMFDNVRNTHRPPAEFIAIGLTLYAPSFSGLS